MNLKEEKKFDKVFKSKEEYKNFIENEWDGKSILEINFKNNEEEKEDE